MKLKNQPRLIILLMTISVTFLSCIKDTIKSPLTTAFTTINAVTGGQGIKVGSRSETISNNNYSRFSLFAGTNDLYVWPAGDSMHPYYVQTKFASQSREAYSLFVCGQPGNTDGVLIKENFPYHTDSTIGVRFINLSPNSTPLNITLSTTPAVNEVSNLAYKQYTDFKKYPATSSISSYTFQIRRASDNVLLYTYNVFAWRFANETVVINGLVNGGPSLKATLMLDDRF